MFFTETQEITTRTEANTATKVKPKLLSKAVEIVPLLLLSAFSNGSISEAASFYFSGGKEKNNL